MNDHPTYIPFELEPSWRAALSEELKQPYLWHLKAFLEKERLGKVSVFPPHDMMFNAFWKTPFDRVRVVIVGQDPYHGPGQAHGLCFSVAKGVQSPPSLQNIFKEIEKDLNLPIPSHGCLLTWAEQGVMMLNATLTVRQSEPMSHHGKGWEKFTDAVLLQLAKRQNPVIFVLWGKNAQEKCKFLNTMLSQTSHSILTAAHPSPLSAHNGFFGCRHFSKINDILQKRGEVPINWQIK